MEKFNKNDLRFNYHPILSFWMILFVILGTCITFPLITSLMDYSFSENTYTRIIITTCYFVATLYNSWWIMKILKKSEGEELDLGNAIGLNIKIFNFISLLFNNFCLLFVSFIKEKFYSKILKTLSIILGLMIFAFGSASNELFSSISNFFISLNISIIIFFYIFYFLLNISYYFFKYTKYENKNLNFQKNYNKIKERMYHNKSILDIIYTYIVPSLELNKWNKIKEYIKDNNLPSAIASIGVSLYSSLFLIIIYHPKYKENGIKVFNPIAFVLSLLNAKLIYFLIYPLKIFTLFLIEIFKFITNTFFIFILISYSIVMNILVVFFFGGVFITTSKNLLLMINFDYSILYNCVVLLSFCICLIIIIIMFFSLFVSTRHTYGLKSNYNRAKYIINMKQSTKINMISTVLSVILMLFQLYTVKDYINFTFVKKIDIITNSYEKDLVDFFGDFENSISRIKKLNQQAKDNND